MRFGHRLHVQLHVEVEGLHGSPMVHPRVQALVHVPSYCLPIIECIGLGTSSPQSTQIGLKVQFHVSLPHLSRGSFFLFFFPAPSHAWFHVGRNWPYAYSFQCGRATDDESHIRLGF